VEDDNTVKLPAAVRNDDGQPCTGTVELCTPDGVLLAKTKICAAPFSTEYVELDLKPGERPSSSVILCLRNSEGVLLDRVADQLYFTKPMPDSALSGIGTVHVLSSEKTVSYCDWFSAQDVELTVHTEKTLVQVDLSDGILILDSSGLAVLGEIIEQGGGRPAALFMVEISTNGPVLPGVNALNFCEPLNTAWKFEPLTGRRLTLAEMLLPAEGMWEADHHVIRSGLDNPRWHSFRFGEPVAHAVILHSGADVSDVMKTVHGVGAGLDSDGENAETFVSAEEDPQNTTHIGSLMTASRREYSVLAETFWNGIPCLLSTLKLGQNLKDDLRAGRLLANALCCLSGSAVPVRPDGFDTVKVFQCLEKCAETIHPALERIRTPEEANYIAIDSRTVFSSTKSKSLLSAKLPEFLLVPAPELVLQGGWKALSVNSCFEVSGPLFPWEFQSRYPMEHGFSGLAFIEDRVLKVYLVEKLTDPDAPPHLRHLFHQLNLYRQAGLDVDVF
jgi:hypothetical protein